MLCSCLSSFPHQYSNLFQNTVSYLFPFKSNLTFEVTGTKQDTGVELDCNCISNNLEI